MGKKHVSNLPERKQWWCHFTDDSFGDSIIEWGVMPENALLNAGYKIEKKINDYEFIVRSPVTKRTRIVKCKLWPTHISHQ